MFKTFLLKKDNGEIVKYKSRNAAIDAAVGIEASVYDGETLVYRGGIHREDYRTPKQIAHDNVPERIRVRRYCNFMYNPDNSCNCSECPENKGFDSWQNRYPCGQQNCWVDIHCKELEDE